MNLSPAPISCLKTHARESFGDGDDRVVMPALPLAPDPHPTHCKPLSITD